MLGAAASYDPASIDQHLQGEERNVAETAVIGERLQSTAGGDPRVLIIRKYGILAMGKSVEEAWMAAYLSVSACEAQVGLTISFSSLFLMRVHYLHVVHPYLT